jgi:hypothetical protein
VGPCRRCGGSGQEPDGLAALRGWLTEHGHTISADDTVRTEAAAAVVGLSPGTLRTMRCYFDGGGLKWHRAGRHCVYALTDLAAWLAARA